MRRRQRGKAKADGAQVKRERVAFLTAQIAEANKELNSLLHSMMPNVIRRGGSLNLERAIPSMRLANVANKDDINTRAKAVMKKVGVKTVDKSTVAATDPLKDEAAAGTFNVRNLWNFFDGVADRGKGMLNDKETLGLQELELASRLG